MESAFGSANMAPTAFAQFLQQNSLPTFNAAVTLRRNNVATGITSSWEIILYGESWTDVVRESHLVVQDIGSFLAARTRVIAADAVVWAGPRIAMRDAIRSLAIAAIAGAASAVGFALVQPLWTAQTIGIAFGVTFGIVFVPGLAVISLTK